MREATVRMAAMVAAYVDLAETEQYGILTSVDQQQLNLLRDWVRVIVEMYVPNPPTVSNLPMKLLVPDTGELVDVATVEEALNIINAERAAKGQPPVKPEQLAVRHIRHSKEPPQ